MTRIIEVVLFVCLAGFFDYMMDAIKDFKTSDKFWLKKWIDRHPKYLNWYKGGESYNPKYPWTSDAWHMAKHFMLLSFAGSVAISLNLVWYYQMCAWWSAYYLEGKIFDLGYQRLK